MYSPSPFAGEMTPENISAYLEQELTAISREFSETQTLELRTLHSAPTKPREGMIVHADGTDWDPGSGQGAYVYQGGAWVFMTQQAQDLSGYLTKAGNLAGIASPSAALATLAGAPLASPALTGNPTAPTQAPGTNNTRLATTAYTDAAVAALVVTGRLVAGTSLVLNPLTFSSTTVQAHGLGVMPLLCVPILECLTGEAGYSAGDKLLLSGTYQFAAYQLDATNVTFVIIGSLQIPSKATHSNVNITAANWKLTVTPYKLV